MALSRRRFFGLIGGAAAAAIVAPAVGQLVRPASAPLYIPAERLDMGVPTTRLAEYRDAIAERLDEWGQPFTYTDEYGRTFAASFIDRSKSGAFVLHPGQIEAWGKNMGNWDSSLVWPSSLRTLPGDDFWSKAALLRARPDNEIRAAQIASERSLLPMIDDRAAAFMVAAEMGFFEPTLPP